MGEYKSMVEAPTGWLGSIPEHWECKKIGSLFSERKTKVSDADYRNKYYTRTVYQTRKFISYWWPIPQDDIDKNWNLVQTPDWTVGNQ